MKSAQLKFSCSPGVNPVIEFLRARQNTIIRRYDQQNKASAPRILLEQEKIISDADASQLDLLSEVLPQVISAFRKLDEDGRQKLFLTIATLFGLGTAKHGQASHHNISAADAANGRFSKDRSISPKEFLLKKQPRTDVERVACLAYYLTNYRDQPYFKTLDISKLNTEAAQIKFANAAKAVNNATSYGYLASATKGNKQISAIGEMFVEALPDREAAKTAMASRPKRRSKRLGRKEDQSV